ncbi:NAD-dependent epimerase [Planotetraspora thailandica]|uniref:NAD-dependent epimerase n=1 Tax=Planotetraspora thailandica TaxID=487172 RepID=A0A8J3V569_9ACTN|nr:NAD-dependent epimerase/dehydratase family protein [Planotetraspora thailandica]GII57598.1 NAD-dependent epimerase [Planotetraspora thailandica]
MKVFITGGSGYLGQAVIRALTAHGHTVSGLARSDAADRTVSALGAEVVRGGLTDLDILRKAADDADGVINLAQHQGPEVAEIGLAAATAMLDGAGDRPYVHTSGTWVYGDTTGVADEDSPAAPPALVSWLPGSDAQVLARAGQGGRPVLVMPGVVYGGGRGLIEEFYAKPARRDGEVRYIGTGSNRWAVVHVDDVAELYVLALGAEPGRKYLAAADQAPTVLEIARAVAEANGIPGKVASITLEQAYEQMGPLADAFALDQQVTSARARAELGWRPAARDVLAELAGA